MNGTQQVWETKALVDFFACKRQLPLQASQPEKLKTSVAGGLDFLTLFQLTQADKNPVFDLMKAENAGDQYFSAYRLIKERIVVKFTGRWNLPAIMITASGLLPGAELSIQVIAFLKTFNVKRLTFDQ